MQTMVTKKSKWVVFRDEEGRFFLLPRETWEKAQVPDEQRSEVEAIVSRGGDVEGFIASHQSELSTVKVMLIPSTDDMDDALESLLMTGKARGLE
jgi:hypothetical protein